MRDRPDHPIAGHPLDFHPLVFSYHRVERKVAGRSKNNIVPNNIQCMLNLYTCIGSDWPWYSHVQAFDHRKPVRARV